MFGVDSTPLDPGLLMFQQFQDAQGGRGGKRSRIFNLTRGRFVKAIFPEGGGQGRIAVGATLRAELPIRKSDASMPGTTLISSDWCTFAMMIYESNDSSKKLDH